MKNTISGKIIISNSTLKEDYFSKSVIYIVEVNENGAWGFVMNNRFQRNINELIEFQHTKAFPLYEGGPIEQDKLFFLHNRKDLIQDGKMISSELYFSGNINHAIDSINESKLNKDEIKFFIGYCGWDKNQLEEEIEEGTWLICNSTENAIFLDETVLNWGILFQEFNN